MVLAHELGHSLWEDVLPHPADKTEEKAIYEGLSDCFAMAAMNDMQQEWLSDPANSPPHPGYQDLGTYAPFSFWAGSYANEDTAQLTPGYPHAGLQAHGLVRGSLDVQRLRARQHPLRRGLSPDGHRRPNGRRREHQRQGSRRGHGRGQPARRARVHRAGRGRPAARLRPPDPADDVHLPRGPEAPDLVSRSDRDPGREPQDAGDQRVVRDGLGSSVAPSPSTASGAAARASRTARS